MKRYRKDVPADGTRAERFFSPFISCFYDCAFL